MNEGEQLPEHEAQKMKDEERQSGNLRWEVISGYFRSGGNLFFIFFTMFMVMLSVAAAAAADYWVSYWSVLPFFHFLHFSQKLIGSLSISE